MSSSASPAPGPDGARAPRIFSAGAWPFVTLHRYVHRGRPVLWRARQHRKGLLRGERGLEHTRAPFWQRAGYNRATGLLFAVGAFLFMLGSVLTLFQGGPGGFSVREIGITFFLGSIPFTIAGYLQHFQAANATGFTTAPQNRPQRIALIGWHPRSPGWLSTFTQFIGTVAFNFNTFDGIAPARGWVMQDVTIWMPGFVGSVLFLVSGFLAYIEAGHAYWSWRPKDLDWQIVFVNLLGCIFFMVAGVLAYVPAGPEPGWIPLLANANLWLGALGFFVGAVLLVRESRLADAG